VEAANFNAPGQVVIAGEDRAVAEASARLRAAGARRVVSLAVSAPFHTSMMRPAAERLAPVLDAVAVRDARIPVLANVSALPVWAPAEIRAALVEQVAAPVRWEESVRGLAALGATTFVEAGPGTTLAGLVRKTSPGARVVSVEDQAGLDAALAALQSGCAPAGAEARG
jgi:[acyl-carrier-protein] S-malonyltransferase